MIPNKPEWKKWSALEKATHLAQIMVPISLLVTVFFSYLAWQESRKSMELQTILFQAQNTPDIEATAIKIIQNKHNPIMLVNIKNTGESTAKNVCVYLYEVDKQNSFISSCDTGRPFSDMSMHKSENFELPLVSAKELEDKLKFRPTTIHFLTLGDEPATCPTKTFGSLLLATQYFDVLNNEYSRLYTLLLCGEGS